MPDISKINTRLVELAKNAELAIENRNELGIFSSVTGFKSNGSLEAYVKNLKLVAEDVSASNWTEARQLLASVLTDAKGSMNELDGISFMSGIVRSFAVGTHRRCRYLGHGLIELPEEISTYVFRSDLASGQANMTTVSRVAMKAATVLRAKHENVDFQVIGSGPSAVMLVKALAQQSAKVTWVDVGYSKMPTLGRNLQTNMQFRIAQDHFPFSTPDELAVLNPLNLKDGAKFDEVLKFLDTQLKDHRISTTDAALLPGPTIRLICPGLNPDYLAHVGALNPCKEVPMDLAARSPWLVSALPETGNRYPMVMISGASGGGAAVLLNTATNEEHDVQEELADCLRNTCPTLWEAIRNIMEPYRYELQYSYTEQKEEPEFHDYYEQCRHQIRNSRFNNELRAFSDLIFDQKALLTDNFLLVLNAGGRNDPWEGRASPFFEIVTHVILQRLDGKGRLRYLESSEHCVRAIDRGGRQDKSPGICITKFGSINEGRTVWPKGENFTVVRHDDRKFIGNTEYYQNTYENWQNNKLRFDAYCCCHGPVPALSVFPYLLREDNPEAICNYMNGLVSRVDASA